MKILAALVAGVGLALSSLPAMAQDYISGIPREEVLIIANTNAPINADWMNPWANGGGITTTGLQQLALDTFWFLNPEGGDGEVWTNSLATEKPIYNEDFTEMRVNLREGIYWSDGVEFSSDDVIYTMEQHLTNPNYIWSAQVSSSLESVEAIDRYSVVFKLKRPNARFHSMFTVRWRALWMMPKHVFETIEDPTKYDFKDVVSIGPYTLQSYDPNGNWYIWHLREDWDRTTTAEYGEPDVKYVAYVVPGTGEMQVVAQRNHTLDITGGVDPEAMFTIMRESDSVNSWLPTFPFARADPTLPSVIFNTQKAPYDNRDVRWAMALLIDMRAVSMASYRGAATISALAVPPMDSSRRAYFEPMQEWLENFELDTGSAGLIKPYDPDMASKIVAMLPPDLKAGVAEDEASLNKQFGYGWWTPNLEGAAALLERAGFTKSGNRWMQPDGTPFSIKLLVRGESEPTILRAGSMIVQQWQQFGIDATLESGGATFGNRRDGGDFDALVNWSIETWGGHPDLSYFLDSWHSEFVAAPGEIQPSRNWQRWSSPELDALIERNRTLGFDDPAVIDLGLEYLKLMVNEMPIIPLFAFNIFGPNDTTYWTGYPDAANPYTTTGPFWANTRTMIVQLKSTKAE